MGGGNDGGARGGGGVNAGGFKTDFCCLNHPTDANFNYV